MPPPDRTRVFVSYSHEDEEWLRRLQIHLRPLAREHPIEVWDDTRIRPTERWREEIEEALQSALVAVLLISADFLASEFIATNELPALLRAAQERGTRILPVIISPSRFTRIEALSQFQAVNDPSQPLVNVSRGEQELIFVKVAESIESVIEAGKLESLEKRVEHQKAQMERQQEIINQLVVFSMAFFLYRMLDDFYRCGEGEMREYIFKKTDRFEHNLRWLRDHGYLEMNFQIGSLQEGQNIADLVRLTPVGKFYVELRRSYEAGEATG